jgi:hypothetical protein
MKLSLLLCLFFVLVVLAPAMHAQDISYQCQVMGQSSSIDCPAYNICYQIAQNYNTRWGFCQADGSGFFCYLAAWNDYMGAWAANNCGGQLIGIKNLHIKEPPDRGRGYALNRPLHPPVVQVR